MQAAPTFTNQLMNRLEEAARQVTGESVQQGRMVREKRCIESRPSERTAASRATAAGRANAFADD